MASKELEYVKSQIVKFKDDLQHYTMVEKDNVMASQIKYDLERFENIEQKLKEHAQYKAIEEELGIDLVTFHKALKNGVYYKVTCKDSVNYGKIFFDRYVLWGWNKNSDGTYFAMMQSQLQSFNLKDYGKTWALTKEELEK